jgi:putative transposase
MKYRFMDDHRAKWPLLAMARALQMTRQGFYAWKKRTPSLRTLREQHLTTQITEVFEQSDGTYGSPRMTHALRSRGQVVTRKTVERYMRKAQLRVTPKRRYRPTTDSSQTLAPAPNLLQRSFNIKQIDRVWVSDFTELPCRNGKAYAVAIMDLCSRRILGITVSYTMQTSTLLHALDQACKLRGTLPEEPLVFHSDRGSQFNADRFRTELAKRNIQQSMSGVGNCYDNASMESFWFKMKSELRQHLLFGDLRHTRSTVYKWVHLFYNRKRLHSSLNFMTPVEFEMHLHNKHG